MEHIALTGSFIQQFDNKQRTFFIAEQDGRCGLLSAPSWETILPFCFDEIHAYPDNTVSVIRNGVRTFFHLIQGNDYIRAVPTAGAVICLPA